MAGEMTTQGIDSSRTNVPRVQHISRDSPFHPLFYNDTSADESQNWHRQADFVSLKSTQLNLVKLDSAANISSFRSRNLVNKSTDLDLPGNVLTYCDRFSLVNNLSFFRQCTALAFKTNPDCKGHRF